MLYIIHTYRQVDNKLIVLKMKIANKQVKQLIERYREIALLADVRAILEWDLNVNLPVKASDGRSRQIAQLTEMITSMWLEPGFRSLVDGIEVDKDSLDELERAVVRNLKREGIYYFKVPKEVIVEKAKTTSQAFIVWQQARKEDSFEEFLPYLKKIINLCQIEAEHLGYKDNPYDALLDLYEPGLTAAYCRKVFSAIQPSLTKTIQQIKKSPVFKDKVELVGGEVVYPVQDQRQLAVFILRKLDYDLQAGRLDISPHPFTTNLDRFDIRITTRYHENDFLDSFTSSIHEAGHALYEQGVKEDFSDTPLDGGVSLGIHESQSRFWENQVGRSPEFISFLAPIFQAFYQEQLSGVGSDTLVRLFNEVKPGFIRVEADEVTYNLHIILRFELEDALINNQLTAEELPDAWNTKMEKYLGIKPSSNRQGVLQDVHWSYGSFGYFPTYCLGNLYAAQITAAMKKELNLKELLGKGELGTILSWLRTNVHQYGSLYWPDELIKKISGEELNPQYFLDYIKEKYSQVYKVKLD